MLPIFSIELDENTEGMVVNSIVDTPAHLRRFIANNSKIKMSYNDEKMEVTGVVISANQPIYYRDQNTPECYLLFKPNVIRQIALNYFKKDGFNKVNFQHEGQIYEDKVVMIETYFSKGKNEFGVEDGSWITTYKVLDPNLYNEIKQGKYTGFSIEGNFLLKELKLNKSIKKSEIMKNLIQKLLKNKEIKQMLTYKTVDGKDFYIDAEEPAEGSKCYILAEDGSKLLAPQGEYAIDIEGTKVIITINELGEIVSIVEDNGNTNPDQNQNENSDVQQSQPDNRLETLENKVNELTQKLESLIITMQNKKVEFRVPDKSTEKDLFNFKI